MDAKKIGKYLVLAGGLYLGINILSEKIFVHQKDIYTTLDSKDKKNPQHINRWAKVEREIDSLQELNDSKQKMIDSLRDITEVGTQYSYLEKIDNYGHITYQHQDPTTTKILNALSGFNTDILYHNSAKEGIWDQDSVLYKTLWAMHIKYKNSKIELVEKFDNETTRADYEGVANNIRLQKNIGLFDQKYYLESWISELSHAYQIRRDGIYVHNEKLIKDEVLMDKQKKTYSDLYEIPGTVEYEAHKIIEETLKKEFIDTYRSLCDTTNSKYLYKILALHTSFFEEYSNIEEAQKYFEKILARDGEIKNELAIKNIGWEGLGYEYEKKRNENGDDKYFQLAKSCYLGRAQVDRWAYYNIALLYIKKGDSDNAMKYYELHSPIDVGIYIALMFMEKKKYKEAVKIYEDKAKSEDIYAMFCLMKLYDPECLDEYEKDFPFKDQAKKEYREEKYNELKNCKE